VISLGWSHKFYLSNCIVPMEPLALFQPTSAHIRYTARVVFQSENVSVCGKALFVVGGVSRFGLD
jgi:hypothetical protein